MAKWKQIEVRARQPLVVILDQVEELFTRPNKLLPNELEDFLAALAAVFGAPEQRPLGKLILGYRKEYHPEIEEGFKAHRLPRATLFLEQLKRKDILDIFRGLTQTHALKVRYNLGVDEELPVTVAGDLLEDRDSPVAPVLQILLTKMWNAATQENPASPRFTVAQYLKLKTEGIAMGEFFEQQMRQLRAWQSDMVDSGLALDVLYFHTTAMGTAGSHSLEEIRRNYQHRQDIIDELIAKCRELYLLTETAEGRENMSLTHDTLAPVVAGQYNSSDKPGQRAARILGNKVSDFRDQQDGIWLDEADLQIVEQGQQGMRQLVIDEEKLLEISRARRRRYRLVRNILVAAVIVSAGIAAWQWREAITQREVARREAAEAQSNLLALQADEMFKADRTQAIRIAETAYHLAPTTSAEKTLLHIYYQTLAGRQRFYASRMLHGDEVTGVAFSPEGSRMLTASRDHTAKLWSASGDLLATLQHDEVVNATIFSPDGQRILTVSNDATAKLWSSQGDSLMIFQHNASVKSACFSADGSRILTASDNGMANL